MFIVLIPAYNPNHELTTLIDKLISNKISNIVIVNDGSDQNTKTVFAEISKFPQVTILRHAINEGKGAALKTGLNYIYITYPTAAGVVTADADGQHLPKDILVIGEVLTNHPNDLVLGARAFSQNVPLRSKFGNELTKKLYRMLVGQKLTDTQSGLRGIPHNFIPTLLKITSNGYEFELDMLLACKQTGRTILEQKIDTVYLNNNQSSHFNPVLDSLKIYFVLFRSALLSFATFLVDATVFSIATALGFGLLASQASARAASILFYYPLAKKAVFFSNAKNHTAFPKYILLVIMSGAICYGIISFLVTMFAIKVISAKIIAETAIYLCNFAIQREFIFTSEEVF